MGREHGLEALRLALLRGAAQLGGLDHAGRVAQKVAAGDLAGAHIVEQVALGGLVEFAAQLVIGERALQAGVKRGAGRIADGRG